MPALGVLIVLAGCSTGLLSGNGGSGPGHGTTSINLSSAWDAVGQLAAPLTTNCSDAGRRVSITGTFGPERVAVGLSGLHSGRRYTFAAYHASPGAAVTLSQTGPIGGLKVDRLTPVAGLEPRAAAASSPFAPVARRGLST